MSDSKKKPWMVCGPLPFDPHYVKGLNQEATTFFEKEGYRALRDPRTEQLYGIFLLPHWESSRGARIIVRRVLDADGEIKSLMRVHQGDSTWTFIVFEADTSAIQKILAEHADAD